MISVCQTHGYRETDRLRREALIHPELEKREPVGRPRFIARHASVGQACVDFGCSRLDLFVGGEIEAISLHRVYVWAVPKEGRMSFAKLVEIAISLL